MIGGGEEGHSEIWSSHEFPARVPHAGEHFCGNGLDGAMLRVHDRVRREVFVHGERRQFKDDAFQSS